MPAKIVISIRVTPETATAIDAARAGLSRARWVENLISGTLEDERGEIELRRAVDTDFTEARSATRCTHPRARVIKNFCYRCGSMVITK
jgi:hypothetical protein